MILRFAGQLDEQQARLLAEKLVGKKVVHVSYLNEGGTNFIELVFDDDSKATFYYEQQGGITLVEGFP
ncbi:MAG: hypothetical protein C4339_06455 [Nitrososphaerota archaeon]